MYRRYYQNDELLSGVILSFTALLVCGFLVSLKLVGEDTFDAEMIVYLVCGGCSLLIAITMLVLFLINNKKPFIDLEIDFKNETISVLNRIRTYAFKDVILYSYNTRHRQVRLLVKRKLLGFTLESILDNKGKPLSIEQASEIGKYGIVIEPKRLYNYHLLISLVFVGLFVFYAFLVSYKDVLWFHRFYIHSYYIGALAVVLIGVSVLVNHNRMRRLYHRMNDTTLSASED